MGTLVEKGHANPSTGPFLLGTAVAAMRLLILWKEMRSARRLLQSMPDNVLSDMGISRGAIEHATSFGRGDIKGIDSHPSRGAAPKRRAFTSR